MADPPELQQQEIPPPGTCDGSRSPLAQFLFKTLSVAGEFPRLHMRTGEHEDGRETERHQGEGNANGKDHCDRGRTTRVTFPQVRCPPWLQLAFPTEACAAPRFGLTWHVRIALSIAGILLRQFPSSAIERVGGAGSLKRLKLATNPPKSATACHPLLAPSACEARECRQHSPRLATSIPASPANGALGFSDGRPTHLPAPGLEGSGIPRRRTMDRSMPAPRRCPCSRRGWYPSSGCAIRSHSATPPEGRG